MATRKVCKHEFETLPEFDRAMRHLVSAPKEAAGKKPARNQAKRTKKPKA